MEYRWGLFDFDTETLVYALIVAAVFHAVWIILSSKINTLFLVAAIFIVLSPFAGAMYFTGIGMVKIARIYFTVLMAVVGIVSVRGQRIGSASVLFILFSLFYVGSAFWSETPGEAFMRKSLLGLLFISGIMMAAGLRTFRRLQNAMRVLLFGCAVFAALIVAWMVMNPGMLGHRLTAYTINPNGTGESGAYMVIISAFVALYDSSKTFKMWGYITGATLATLIPFTGSRAGFGIALVGCGFLALPLVRRPLMFALLMICLAGTGFGIAQFVQPEYASRLTDSSLEDREGVWEQAYLLIHEKPILGHGFIGESTRTELVAKNMHSVYLQVMVDTGIVGLTLLLACLAWTFIRSTHALRACRAAHFTPPFYLAMGLFLASVLSGFFDIGWIVGTTVGALLFAFSIGLIDSIPDMAEDLMHSVGSEQMTPDEYWQMQQLAQSGELVA